MEFTGWRYPLIGWVMIDVDGYSKENSGMAGVSGVIRDDMRIWIVGFTLNIGICTSACAELWAVNNGLNLAWSKV